MTIITHTHTCSSTRTCMPCVQKTKQSLARFVPYMTGDQLSGRHNKLSGHRDSKPPRTAGPWPILLRSRVKPSCGHRTGLTQLVSHEWGSVKRAGGLLRQQPPWGGTSTDSSYKTQATSSHEGGQADEPGLGANPFLTLCREEKSIAS